MIYEVTVDGAPRQIEVERSDGGYRVRVADGPWRQVDARWIGTSLSLLLEDRSFDVGLVRNERGWEANVLGTLHVCEVVDPRRKALRMAGGAAQGTLSTSMPGRVVTVLVAVGDEVEKGQPLIVVEAMKMENELKAPVAGKVQEILVKPGQAVEAGAKLLRIG